MSRLLASTSCLLALLMASTTQAETPITDIPLGQSHTLHSTILGEDRVLNVLLPLGYDESNRTYPVIYLLDGAVSEDYHHVSGLLRYLETYELMPPSILVGIANTDRTRDLTFPTDIAELRERSPTLGGSAKFRRFLAEEVKPYVAANLRTDGTSTLIGQSLGGLLATEVFVETPGLFDHYVIVSPSLWWDDYTLVPRIATSLRAHPETKAKVCLVVGAEGPSMEGPAHAFAAALAAHAPEGLTWKHISLPEETHATALHRGLYAAIEWLYGAEYPGM